MTQSAARPSRDLPRAAPHHPTSQCAKPSPPHFTNSSILPSSTNRHHLHPEPAETRKDMSILITGAAGWIGQELTLALLEADASTPLIITDVVEPSLSLIPTHHHSRVTTLKLDLTSPSTVTDLIDSTPLQAVYLLHGIMSGGSEADLEAGYAVNLDSVRTVLDALRRAQPGVVVVFTSSLAVYGPAAPGQVTREETTPQPQSSYGTQKFMVETLLNDYSRRGLLDGRACRLPTLIVRPGKPSAAASSFASGIVRESLRGVKNVLPVDPGLEMWVGSARAVVRNLVRAKGVDKGGFGLTRTVNLPGLTVTVGQILEALEKVGGKEARGMVVEERDEKVERIVASWPARFDTRRARELGFEEDRKLEEIVREFAQSLEK